MGSTLTTRRWRGTLTTADGLTIFAGDVAQFFHVNPRDDTPAMWFRPLDSERLGHNGAMCSLRLVDKPDPSAPEQEWQVQVANGDLDPR